MGDSLQEILRKQTEWYEIWYWVITHKGKVNNEPI